MKKPFLFLYLIKTNAIKEDRDKPPVIGRIIIEEVFREFIVR